MSNLTWFQYDVDAWEERVRDLGLSLEDEGAVMRLLRHSWGAKQPGTLPDDHDTFARILGARWRKFLPLVYRFFKAIEGQPGMLHSEWFGAIYSRADTKHKSYVKRGKMGGRPKKERKPQLVREKAGIKAQVSNTKSSASESGPERGSSASSPLVRESSSEGFSSTTAKPPAQDAAPAGTARVSALESLRSRIETARQARPEYVEQLEAETREELSLERRRVLTREDERRVLELMVAALDSEQPRRAVGDE